MTKNNHTFLTIFILLAITVGVILAFSNLSPSNNLNANDQNNPPITEQPPFSFLPARASTEPHIQFETNFGGDDNDVINKVYSLDFYYIIGTTESNTHYMQQNKQTKNIFVIKATRAGMALSVAVPNLNISTEFVESYVTGNGIYILTKETGKQSTVVLLYSFASQDITEVTTIKNQLPLSITKADTLIITTTQNNNLNVVFYNETNKTSYSNGYSIDIDNVILTAPYKSGALVFVNSGNNFYAIYFTDSSTEVVISVLGYNLTTFNISSLGYLFILQNSTSIYTIFCDHTFKILTTNTISYTSKNMFALFTNNATYLASVNTDNTINVLILSVRGDLVFNINLPYLVKNILILKQDENYFQIYAKSQDNMLKIITLTNLTTEVNKVIINLPNLTTLNSVERDIDNNFFLFGSFSGTSNAQKNNFGKQDAFMIKLFKIY